MLLEFRTERPSPVLHGPNAFNICFLSARDLLRENARRSPVHFQELAAVFKLVVAAQRIGGGVSEGPDMSRATQTSIMIYWNLLILTQPNTPTYGQVPTF
jgi:hypothetical protein